MVLQSTTKNKVFYTYIVLAFAVLIVCPPSISAKEVIRITNGEWPPYLSENLPHYGSASHVVAEAFAAVRVNVEYGFFPWKRSYQYAKAGKDHDGNIWHGTVVWVHTEKRANDFWYSQPVVIDSEVLFHLKSKPLDWKVIDDLRGMRIGATLHTVYPIFEAAEKEGVLVMERRGNYDILFKRLLYRYLDAVPQVKQVGRYYLNTSLTDEERTRITYSSTEIQERKYHLLLSKQLDANVRLLRLFDEGLRRIQENGLYKSLYDNFEKGK